MLKDSTQTPGVPSEFSVTFTGNRFASRYPLSSNCPLPINYPCRTFGQELLGRDKRADLHLYPGGWDFHLPATRVSTSAFWAFPIVNGLNVDVREFEMNPLS
jgi:hypothetical protein